MHYFLRGTGSDTAIASAESDEAARARLADGWREVKWDVWREWWKWHDLFRLWELREEAANALPQVKAIGDALPPKGFVKFQG